MTDAPLLLTPARKPAWRAPLITGVIAFLVGLAAMAALFQYRDRLFPAKEATVKLVAPSGQQPVVIVPAAPGSAPAPVIDVGALTRRETELAAHLAELETRVQNVGTEAQAASGYATRSEAMLVAFAARRALDRGLGLGYIEEQLRARFGGSQPRAVATILQAARNPVTIEDLRGGLDGISADLVTGTLKGGWMDSLRREIGNLVVLHKAGTPSPLPADRLLRAKRMLDSGQVEGALAEVARMPGAAQADRWMDAARRYVGVRQALDTIETAAILGQASVAAPSAPDVPGLGTAGPNP